MLYSRTFYWRITTTFSKQHMNYRHLQCTTLPLLGVPRALHQKGVRGVSGLFQLPARVQSEESTCTPTHARAPTHTETQTHRNRKKRRRKTWKRQSQRQQRSSWVQADLPTWRRARLSNESQAPHWLTAKKHRRSNDWAHWYFHQNFF